MMTIIKKKEIRLKGIIGSPGICIGKAYRVDREGVDVVEKYRIEDSELKNEKNRFKAAVQKATEELRGIIKNTPEDYQEHAQILETHVVLLKDKMLYEKTIAVIEKERVNAEWALKMVVSDLQSVFQSMADPYLKERARDIVHVSERIMRNLKGINAVSFQEIDKRVILVARDLSPAETSQIQLERIKGFVTDHGGTSSHTSIIARSLQIPAVLGLGNISLLAQNEDTLILDGSTGLVILHPSQETLYEYKRKKDRYEAQVAVLVRSSRLPAKTKDGHHIRIQGNIELPEEVVSVLDHGGEGVGLYRTEFQYLGRSGFPAEDELFEKYLDVVEVMKGKPVTIRTLDINGEKALSSSVYEEEKNPVLGLRAIRYCLQNPEVFKTQLRAILRVAASGNVRIMFPMISGHDELIQAKNHLKIASDELMAEGVECNPDIEIGVLIEVPSAVVLADVLAKEVDFFSIGTNDLIQYSLAIDRGNPKVAHLYRPLHPAVIRMLKQIADAAAGEKIRVSMCGEMAGEPIHVPLLLGLGITELSMNPQFIPMVKRMIGELNLKDCRKCAKEIMRETTVEAVTERMLGTYSDLVAEKIFGGKPGSGTSPVQNCLHKRK
ncbi:MAG: phosphoenolpyruvate--protein phosphotransferase [Thermodesulfobacteriota bacterium]